MCLHPQIIPLQPLLAVLRDTTFHKVPVLRLTNLYHSLVCTFSFSSLGRSQEAPGGRDYRFPFAKVADAQPRVVSPPQPKILVSTKTSLNIETK